MCVDSRVMGESSRSGGAVYANLTNKHDVRRCAGAGDLANKGKNIGVVGKSNCRDRAIST